MKAFAVTCLLLVGGLMAWAQPKYWVLFTDKGPDAPHAHRFSLSPDALQRRALQGIPLDDGDRPVCATYVHTLRQLGCTPLQSSRWLNGVSLRLTEAQRARVEALPFVRGLRPVRRFGHPTEHLSNCDSLLDAYTPFYQLQMLGLDRLHASGFRGQGVRIAVFDNGFIGVDQQPGFAHLFETGRLVATRDFVDGDEDVFEACQGFSHCQHGTSVLSVLAAKLPGSLTGSAPEASYLLLRTEDDAGERSQEEDNWVAAAEYADSLGAHVFTTSLGYLEFDGGAGSYAREDLDGMTALITLAADMAAQKGIVVVNSAGNGGSAGLSAPADGFNVLAVGSVDACGRYSAFSSRGPTADGRLKPEVAAMGQQTYVLNAQGTLRQANGTSFAAPLVAGLMACLVQAAPAATRPQLYEALFRASHQYEQPDRFLGYGIPQAPLAFEFLLGHPLPSLPAALLQAKQQGIIFPNPNRGSFWLALAPGSQDQAGKIDIIDLSGRVLFSRELALQGPWQQVRLDPPLLPGYYVLRVRASTAEGLSWQGKLVVR